MAPWLIGAAFAVAGAVACFISARTEQSKYDAAVGLETSTTELLHELHRTATETAGKNSYSELVELDGTAHPAPSGSLTAEISGTECVWYMQKVTRRYKEVYRDSEGRRKVRNKDEVVSRNRSRDPFLLRDETGEVTIVPSTNVQSARKVVAEFRESNESRKGASISIGGFNLNLPTGGGDGDTIGYKYEEWVLTEGTRIYVRGEAVDRNGKLEVRGPRGKDAMVISTKSEEEMLAEHKKKATLARLGTSGLAVAAVALLVAAFVIG